MLDFQNLKPGDQVRDEKMAYLITRSLTDEITLRNGPLTYTLHQGDAQGFEQVTVGRILSRNFVRVVRKSNLRHSAERLHQIGTVEAYNAPYYIVCFEDGGMADFLFAELNPMPVMRGDQLKKGRDIFVVTRSPHDREGWFSPTIMIYKDGLERGLEGEDWILVRRSRSPLGAQLKVTADSLPLKASLFIGQTGMLIEVTALSSGVYHLLQFGPNTDQRAAYLPDELELILPPRVYDQSLAQEYFEAYRL